LHVWRAPIDNERGFASEPLELTWRWAGLDRLTERIDTVEVQAGGLVVTGRVASAGTDVGFLVTYRWRGDGDEVALEVEVEPQGTLPPVLPRVGIRLALPVDLQRVRWFGRGPGEAYPDTGIATWIGRFDATVAELQTPYLYPQENGNRSQVRWLTLSDDAGAGLRVEGRPTVEVAVRPWSTEELTDATHRHELSPGDQVWLHLDTAHNGVGSASCGPPLLPDARLTANAPHRLAVVLRSL
jgi:beta-galactosidase